MAKGRDSIMDLMSMVAEESYNDDHFLNHHDGSDKSDMVTFAAVSEVKKIREIGDDNASIELLIPEEEVTFKRFSKIRERRYTEQELDKMKYDARHSIVFDYGPSDTYHMSDEEQLKRNELGELGMRLRSVKRSHGNAADFVKDMRLIVEAWEKIAETNGIYTKEEFFRLVRKGRIISAIVPYTILRKKRLYDMDTIMRYVSDTSLDPMDLLTESDRERRLNPYANMFGYDENDDDGDENQEPSTLDESELSLIKDVVDGTTEMPEAVILPLPEKFIHGYDRQHIRGFGVRKEQFKGSKKDKIRRKIIHRDLNELQATAHIKRLRRDSYSASGIFDVKGSPTTSRDKFRYGGSLRDNELVDMFVMIRDEMSKDDPISGRAETVRTALTNEIWEEMELLGLGGVKRMREKVAMSKKHMRVKRQVDAKDRAKREAAILRRVHALNNNPKIKKVVEKAENKMAEQERNDYTIGYH